MLKMSKEFLFFVENCLVAEDMNIKGVLHLKWTYNKIHHPLRTVSFSRQYTCSNFMEVYNNFKDNKSVNVNCHQGNK
jgi:hypothetical protein